MRIVFVDTSALVKLFVQEPGSTRMLDTARNEGGDTIVVLDLSRVELHAAIHRRERAGDVPAGTTRRSRELLEQYLRSKFVVQHVSQSLLERACALVERHGLRAYDALQLAGALEAAVSRGELEALFVSADQTLTKAASEEGLPTLDPTLAGT